jgi:hypothetical protein
MDYQSWALSKVRPIPFKSIGDRLVTWFDRHHLGETVVAQLGAMKTGVVLTPVQNSSDQDLVSALGQAKGCVLSPNSKVSQESAEKKSSMMTRLVPEIRNLQNGKSVNSQTFPNLKCIVHTGFYSFPGMLKYKVRYLPLKYFQGLACLCQLALHNSRGAQRAVG